MVRKRDRLKKLIRSRDGISLPSVLVAFVMLLICALIFQKAVTLSMGFMQTSSSMRERADKAVEEYYSQQNVPDENMQLDFTEDGGDSFSLDLKRASKAFNGITLYYYGY